MTIGGSCYKDFDTLVILPVAFGSEAPSKNPTGQPTGQKIQSSASFLARVNESERARNEKMAILLAFTLATNKAEACIF